MRYLDPDLTQDEAVLIRQIAQRAARLRPFGQFPELNYFTLIAGVHVHDRPLDLARMALASDWHLMADIISIQQNRDWHTDQLLNGFISAFAWRYADADLSTPAQELTEADIDRMLGDGGTQEELEQKFNQ